MKNNNNKKKKTINKIYLKKYQFKIKMEIICKKVSKIISNSDNQNYASNNNNFLVIILLAMMIHIMKDTQI